MPTASAGEWAQRVSKEEERVWEETERALLEAPSESVGTGRASVDAWMAVSITILESGKYTFAKDILDDSEKPDDRKQDDGKLPREESARRLSDKL